MNELIAGFLWVLGGFLALVIGGLGLLLLLFLVGKSIQKDR